MRSNAKKAQNVQVNGIQGYHQGGSWDGESYAFAGFPCNGYFNSDRMLPVVINDRGYLERLDGMPMAGYGTEMEIECNSILNTAVLAEIMTNVILPKFKFGKKMFKLQSDSSLGGRTSVEVISQVMTKGRIRNDYAAYKTMYDTYFPNLGLKSDSYETSCGMHVNVSLGVFGKTKGEQYEAIRKLYYLINKNHRFFAKAFYRDPENTYWCNEMTESHLDAVESYHLNAHQWRWQNAKNLDFDADRLPMAHQNCLNVSHIKAGRIEIRLVGGQRNYFTYRNTMEMVFWITENIGRMSWTDLDDLVKVFKGCNQYVCKRLADCTGYDGFTGEMYTQIMAASKVEDLELTH